ncbi:hypothetical protein LSM04_008544 [Trypanosoma melophagium]|uniref:uncharacterized protein n=1 Tax=Trypanosoma melophagium TaxID=715481 RepID=UPI00351A26C2|nr:hypothetical protein LSM04_008544 [Trypanosoma melophagium]
MERSRLRIGSLNFLGSFRFIGSTLKEIKIKTTPIFVEKKARLRKIGPRLEADTFLLENRLRPPSGIAPKTPHATPPLSRAAPQVKKRPFAHGRWGPVFDGRRIFRAAGFRLKGSCFFFIGASHSHLGMGKWRLGVCSFGGREALGCRVVFP